MANTQSLSLRWRVVIVSTLTLLVFFSLAGIGLQKAYNDSLDNAAESELRAYMFSLLGSMDVNESGEAQFFDLPITAFYQPNSGIYAEVWDKDTLLWRSDSLIGKPLPRVESSLGEYRLYSGITGEQSGNTNLLSFLVDWSDENLSKQFSLVVANDAEPYIQRQSAYKNNLLLWLLGLGLGLLVLQASLFRWLFKPISQVSNELSNIKEGRQSDFVGVYPHEVSELTKSLNTFLLAERKQIKRVRNSLSNLAHSLKTPLAAMRGELSESKVDKKLLAQQVDRIATVVDYQLNKTSSSIRPSYRQAQPCAERIERLVAVMQKLNKDKGISIVGNIDKKAKFYGDVDDLIEIVGNLLENACKWASSRVLVDVKSLANNKLQLRIIDDGKGVPQDKVEEILSRGKRLDETVEGQGIGLAMVNDLVDSYAGELSFAQSTTQQPDFSSGLAVLVLV